MRQRDADIFSWQSQQDLGIGWNPGAGDGFQDSGPEKGTNGIDIN